MEEQVKARVCVFGKVQGVFFRRSARIKADELGIVGWVKNRDDGGVEALAQGTREKVDQFIKWCKKGPPFAKVENVEVNWKKDKENLEEFSIVD